MMDSNNALFIRGAETFRRDYMGFVQGILDDPRQAKPINEQIAATPRETLVKEEWQPSGKCWPDTGWTNTSIHASGKRPSNSSSKCWMRPTL